MLLRHLHLARCDILLSASAGLCPPFLNVDRRPVDILSLKAHLQCGGHMGESPISYFKTPFWKKRHAVLQRTCQICFDEFDVKNMRAARCKHYFCLDCWRGYVSTAINSGPSVLNLRCPLPDCKSAVRLCSVHAKPVLQRQG
jgi:hypothetical protein